MGKDDTMRRFVFRAALACQDVNPSFTFEVATGETFEVATGETFEVATGETFEVATGENDVD